MEETANTILEQVPNTISMEEVMLKYPVQYKESMNTVLVQEVSRYNKLLTTVKQTLQVNRCLHYDIKPSPCTTLITFLLPP